MSFTRSHRGILLGAVALLSTACVQDDATQSSLDQTERSDTPSLFRAGNRYGWGGQDRYVDEVQTVLAKRCTTCHGCSDSPCQLKLTSLEGLLRGGNESNVYDPTRVFSAAPQRLQDTRATAEDGLIDWTKTGQNWQSRGYYSVVEGGEDALMYRLLQLAHDNPIEERDLSPAQALSEEVMPERSFQCAGPDQQYTDEELLARPMPMGLPDIGDAELEALQSWIREGAQRPPREVEKKLATPMNPEVIQRWESFFNQDSEKGQLVARYIYEHLFSHHLHFPEMPGEYYELVRSATAAPKPIVELVTELPHDEPATGKATLDVPFYRLRKITSIIVQKSHITWELSEAKLARWTELFLDPSYDVDMPGYGDDNPFSNFHDLPSKARAYFMIENAHQIVEAMVKADVCTGSGATYAIRDRFWVWFMDPEQDPSARDPKLGNWTYLHLNPGGFDLETSYQESFEEQLRDMHPNGLSMDAVWNGNGNNPNAWLTVLRHETSASVHYGAVNGRPETLWLLSYSNFERLYYNLVVNFRTWGALSHQASTWKYMSRIRTEGEDLWLSLLPEQYRQPMRDQWTHEFGSFFANTLQDWIEGDLYSEGRGSQVQVGSEDPMGDLIALGQDRIGETITGSDQLNPGAYVDPRADGPAATLPEQVTTFGEFEQALSALSGWRGPHAKAFPNITIVRATDGQGEVRVYTVINNRGYASHDLLTGEGRARSPEQDVLSTMRGVAGSYPELFIDVPLGASATAFTKDMSEIESPEDWTTLMAKYGEAGGVHVIQRSDRAFWPFLDAVHDWHVQDQPVRSGILDVSNYIWPR